MLEFSGREYAASEERPLKDLLTQLWKNGLLHPVGDKGELFELAGVPVR